MAKFDNQKPIRAQEITINGQKVTVQFELHHVFATKATDFSFIKALELR